MCYIGVAIPLGYGPPWCPGKFSGHRRRYGGFDGNSYHEGHECLVLL